MTHRKQALALVDAIPSLQGERGRPRLRPDCVFGDRGYDAEAIRQGLRAVEGHDDGLSVLEFEKTCSSKSGSFDRCAWTRTRFPYSITCVR